MTLAFTGRHTAGCALYTLHSIVDDGSSWGVVISMICMHDDYHDDNADDYDDGDDAVIMDLHHIVSLSLLTRGSSSLFLCERV